MVNYLRLRMPLVDFSFSEVVVLLIILSVSVFIGVQVGRCFYLKFNRRN